MLQSPPSSELPAGNAAGQLVVMAAAVSRRRVTLATWCLLMNNKTSSTLRKRSEFTAIGVRQVMDSRGQLRLFSAG